MDRLLFDLRYAVRRLRHSPGFTLVVAVTLALGIGANSAIFSVVDAVLLRPLPYERPEQLVTIHHVYPAQKLEASVSAPGFQAYRDRGRDFDGVAAGRPWNVNLTGIGEPERLGGVRVSGLFFSTLGVSAARGRALRPDEDEPGKEHEVVLSDGLWKRLFGAQPGAIGRKVSLNNETYEVVGVMPPTFVDPWNRTAEIWAPLALSADLFAPHNFTNEFLSVIARLKPGVSVHQAVRDMDAMAAQLRTDYPSDLGSYWGLGVKSLMDERTGNIRPALLILLGAVGFVLLIACANVANLFLARAAARQKEVAIRTALGADQWALVRQLLVESTLLSLIGGALGLALAYASVRALVASNPSNIPRVNELGIDARVVIFTAVVSIVTGIVFGLVPAFQSSNAKLHTTLKEGGRSGTADGRGQLVRRSLVVTEVALALTLLTGGGLLVRSFTKLTGVAPGFNARDVVTFGLALPLAKYGTDTTRRAFYAELIPRIEQVPGVKAAGAVSLIPFDGGMNTATFNVEGYVVPPRGNQPWGDIGVATPGYFNAMQIPLVRGRTFDRRDEPNSTRVAVVDEEFVRRFYKPGEDPIGKRLWFGALAGDSSNYITIVGVVGHAKQERLDADARAQLYTPVVQNANYPAMTIAVRTEGDPIRHMNSIRSAVHEVDRDLPLARIMTMDQLIESSMGQRRLSTALLGVFAGIALVLASLGIYGVMSYTVAQRTRELGVRVALGASRQSVLGMVLKQGMTLAVIGVAIGLAGAAALTRFMASQLYDVRATDPLTFATVTGVLAVVALGATLVPALRATRVDPIVALREE